MKNVFIHSFLTNSWLQLERQTSSLKYEDIIQQFSQWQNLTCPILKIHWGSEEITAGDEVISEDCDVFLRTSIPLCGGKGGFGSMLRAIGAQIEKTTNREACRDLSGRRLRDINEEKRLKNWVEKQAEREKEAEERKRKKLEKLKFEYKHEFHDPDYDKARSEVTEKVHDAVVNGFQVASSSQPPEAKKPKLDKPMKTALWTGVSDEDLDSSDVDSSDEESKEASEAANTDQSSQVAETSDFKPESSENPELITEKDNSLQGETGNETKVTEQQTEANLQPPTKNSVDFSTEPPINLEEYETAESLESLGLDRLKYELVSRGLKCGGTLKERAARLISVKNLKPEEIDPSLLSKPPKQQKK